MSGNFLCIVLTVFCYLGYICAAGKFCAAYLEISKRKELLFVILIFGSWMLTGIANLYIASIPYIFFALVRHLFFMGTVLLLFQSNTEKKILVTSMLIVAETLTTNFCGSLLSCLMLFWLHTVKHIAVPVCSEQVLDLITCACYLGAAFVALFMSNHLQSVFYCKTRKWYLLLAIPLLAVTGVIDVANWGATKGILVRSGGNMGLYYDELFSHAEFCVLDILSMFAAGFYVYGMERISLEQKKSSQYHFQIAAYKMLEAQYSQSERLRHDMKNHVLALLGLLEKKEWKKAQDYLKNMAEHAGLEIGEELTGNRVVDVLLSQSRKKAEENNILWKCDVQMPKICCINVFDLCVLFGNILDNALESCARLQCDAPYCTSQQFICIQAGVVKKCFLLEVQNSADDADCREAAFPDKKHFQGHGIGLLNIRDVVNRYQGVMNIELQNGVFSISVLVPMNDAVHDIKQAT